MNIKLIIHKMLSQVMHAKRLTSLEYAVESAFECRQLSVTGLGRSLSLPIQERSGIRKMDRLVGNQKLHAERKTIYRVVARELISEYSQPWIVVDWSPIPNTDDNLLRAAIVCRGRALSVYEEVHPLIKLGNQKVQSGFLKTLKELLPKTTQPIIVTDAGFHASWFKAIQKQGWNFVGRLRGLVKYRLAGELNWNSLNTLYSKASTQAKSLGQVTISKSDSIPGTLCYYKGNGKGRINKNKLGQRRQEQDSQNYSRSAKEPWILFTSLKSTQIAKRLVKIYKQRMQIEEGFRDLKSSLYGFGFEKSYSKQLKRIENLLLIAMLASFLAWLIGWSAEKEQKHYQFQANSIKHRRVLSLFYLGCRIIKKKLEIKLCPIEMITSKLEWANAY